MRPRVAVVSHNVDSAGGTRTLTDFLCGILERSGRYEPHVISLAASAADPASVLLRRPGSWPAGLRVEEGSWRGRPLHHVGAWAAELETQRYRPRRVLTELLERYDLVQFAVGAPPWACVALEVERPVLLWAATTIDADRKSQLEQRRGPRRGWSLLMTRWAAAYERRALRSADVVFALSEYTYDALRPHVERAPLLLAPCGVDTELFRPTPHPSADYILGVARFHDPRKNVALLLRAYARLKRAGGAVPDLYMVGEAPSQAARELITQLGISDSVRFLGVQPLAELVSLYQNARLFVLPSDEEGLGIVVLEALATGTPVVSTACGGPETAIIHGETGLLTPVGDVEAMAEAIGRVLGDPGLQRRLRSAGRAVAERRFSLEAAGRVFLESYDAVLEERGTAAARVGVARATSGVPRIEEKGSGAGRGDRAAVSGTGSIPVSVVIPFYDGYATIQRVIDSIERQTLRPREIVLVDDGSSRPIAPADVRSSIDLRILRHPENRGIPSARNTGIRAAREEWIAFIDHDDEWMPRKLESQWSLASRIVDPANEVLYGRCLWLEPEEEKAEVFPGSHSLEVLRRGGETAARELLVRGLSVPFITILAHRSLFQRHGYLDEGIRGGSDDHEFVIRLAARGVRFDTADFASPEGYSAIYHMAARNYSRRPWFLQDEYAYLRRLAGEHPSLRPQVRRALARAHFRAGRIHERLQERPRAALHYRRSIALDWTAPHPWIALLALPMPRAVRTSLAARWRQVRSWRADLAE